MLQLASQFEGFCRDLHSECRVLLDEVEHMATKSRSNKPSERSAFKVGDRVSVRPGLYDAVGTIVEDRGFIGAGGRRLWRVKVELDPPDVTYIELLEAEMKAVQ